jgi:hemerythrin
MGGFVWTEAMSVGVPALDSDHRCLVRIINVLADAEGDDQSRVVGIVLDTLGVYCRYHFAREEQVMAACGFPELGFHRREHDGFSRTVTILNEPCDDKTRAADLLQYLKEWLLHHILIQDMAYKPYVIAAQDRDAFCFAISEEPDALRLAGVSEDARN